MNYKYLMLPYDEEPFEIDANSRSIKVPNVFKKNGIGVQGDEIAETLFFTVDRFFDAMDLDNTDIYVQWENTLGEQFVTPIVMKDLTRYPGKILFAWPLSSDLTKKQGSVKFSVRFVRFDSGNNIIYSLSTLTAVAAINPALNYDIDTTAKDNRNEDWWLEAIKNSQSIIGEPASTPMFSINLDDSKMYYVSQVGDDYTCELVAYATVTDSGSVSYEWYHTVPGKISRRLGEGVQDFVLASSIGHSSSTAHHIYYKKIAEGNYQEWDPIDPEFDITLAYVKRSKYIVSGKEISNPPHSTSNSITGTYNVIATNRYGNKESSAKSKTITIPAPAEAVLIKDGNNNSLAGGIVDEKDGLTLSVNWETPAENTDVVCHWFYADTAEGEMVEYTDGGSNHNLVVFGEEVSAGGPGWYKVEVENILNLDAITVSSNIVRAAFDPKAPKFEDDWTQGSPDKTFNINVTDEISLVDIITEPKDFIEYVGVDQRLISDEISYDWYTDPQNDKGTNGLEKLVFYATTPTPVLKIGEGLSGGANLICVAKNRINDKIVYSMSAVCELSSSFTE